MVELSVYHYIIAALSALLLGMTKAGIKGIDALIVTGFALVYGAKTSTGILMPLLIIGDLFAITYYKRHVDWKSIIKLIPWMILGVLIGAFGGKTIPDNLFTYGMASIILFSVAMMYYWDTKKDNAVPSHISFAATMGVFAGVSTMIGNLAGAFSNIYFLAMRFQKNNFIGTAAWLFFFTNLFKVPLHIFSWKTLNERSILFSIQLVPFVLMGLFIGVLLVKKIKNESYRKIILFFTALGGVLLLFR
ncbi:MAG: sulfite exporter TauE/SafE family protein [Flavobacteriaceae bacterium]